MAMTLGTFVLMLLELQADPLRTGADPLAAVASDRADFERLIRDTQVPLQPTKWRNVIVHSSPSSDSDLARGCHFIVFRASGREGATVRATARWGHQMSGDHAFVRGYDFNQNSIGVCVVGDFSSRPPGREQFDSTVGLVRGLRRYCRIPFDRVYLGSQLPIRTRTPGEAFPEKLFEDLVKAPLR